ncbi:uncharacterized protein BJ171DRAFT_598715 [Polychytrium aggregatum]|uniref:uncharacterized protein n=1 Tax=Polychytrium aggregatum TaxID=110093 RepID=UPI0022FEA936|nr:uncharacterized protein BJ171DRAFT_598715 [Polychytrium aggregatum]KAI9205136.1 hypothetical protein BJ171DRAFT_598715 [Polychytrium aggregatum]
MDSFSDSSFLNAQQQIFYPDLLTIENLTSISKKRLADSDNVESQPKAQNTSPASTPEAEDPFLAPAPTKKKPGRKPSSTEPPNKRTAQNRAAQRAFRERKERYVKELEARVHQLENMQTTTEPTSNVTLESENKILKQKVEELERENSTLREMTFTFKYAPPTTTMPLSSPFKTDSPPPQLPQATPSPLTAPVSNPATPSSLSTPQNWGTPAPGDDIFSLSDIDSSLLPNGDISPIVGLDPSLFAMPAPTNQSIFSLPSAIPNPLFRPQIPAVGAVGAFAAPAPVLPQTQPSTDFNLMAHDIMKNLHQLQEQQQLLSQRQQALSMLSTQLLLNTNAPAFQVIREPTNTFNPTVDTVAGIDTSLPLFEDDYDHDILSLITETPVTTAPLAAAPPTPTTRFLETITLPSPAPTTDGHVLPAPQPKLTTDDYFALKQVIDTPALYTSLSPNQQRECIEALGKLKEAKTLINDQQVMDDLCDIFKAKAKCSDMRELQDKIVEACSNRDEKTVVNLVNIAKQKKKLYALRQKAGVTVLNPTLSS